MEPPNRHLNTSCALSSKQASTQMSVSVLSVIHTSPRRWLIAIAFWLSKGFIKSGLGNRIAYSIVSKFGSTTLGLTYSLVLAEALLAPAIPSVAARAGGIFFPLAQVLSGAPAKFILPKAPLVCLPVSHALSRAAVGAGTTSTASRRDGMLIWAATWAACWLSQCACCLDL